MGIITDQISGSAGGQIALSGSLHMGGQEVLSSDGKIKRLDGAAVGSGLEVVGSQARIAADGVKNSHIDWGTGLNQVSTTDVIEGSNQYYTAARWDSKMAAADTGDLSEGSNLYYTAARWDAKLAAADTGDLTEGSNLYYTQARADARVDAGFAAKDTGDLSEGSNLYYTAARWDAKLAAADTGDLTEGSNLYYTQARADARVDAGFAAKDTGDLSEGSNLYYTDARARAAISHVDVSGDGSLAYNGSTGVITYTGPSPAEARAHFDASANDGLSYTEASGEFSLAQDIRTSASPTFAGMTINGDLLVTGSLTSVHSTELKIKDVLITVASGAAGLAVGQGFEIGDNKGSFKIADHADGGTQKVFESSQRIKAPYFYGDGSKLTNIDGGAVSSVAGAIDGSAANKILTHDGDGSMTGETDFEINANVMTGEFVGMVSYDTGKGAGNRVRLSGQKLEALGSGNLGIEIKPLGTGEVDIPRLKGVLSSFLNASHNSITNIQDCSAGNFQTQKGSGSRLVIDQRRISATGSADLDIYLTPAGNGKTEAKNLRFDGSADANGQQLQDLGGLTFNAGGDRSIQGPNNADLVIQGQGTGKVSLQAPRLDAGAMDANNQGISDIGDMSFNQNKSISMNGGSHATALQFKHGPDAYLTFDTNAVQVKVSRKLWCTDDLQVDNDVVLGSSAADSITLEGYVTAKADIKPNAPGIDLGASDKKWSKVYAEEVHAGDLCMQNARGSWRLIEESEFLTLRNEKTGKRYKFNMTLLPEDQWDPDGNWEG